MGMSSSRAVAMVLVLLTANAVTAATETASAPYSETINDVLKGKKVIIELDDGTTITKAKKVEVEPQFTYWRTNGREASVANDKIVRISARSKSHGWIGLGAGAVVGLVGMATTSDDSNSDNLVSNDTGFLPSQSNANNVSAVFTALLGYGVDRMIPRKRKLVYDKSSEIPQEHRMKASCKKRKIKGV